MAIKAIIVDDEVNAGEILQWELNRCAFDIEVIRTFQSPQEALKDIPHMNFDILFLDIDMPKMSGFDLLHSLGEHNFGVIFVTAYDQYALKAIKNNALDYIVKPVDKEELEEAIVRWEKQFNPSAQASQMQALFDSITQANKPKPERIAIPSPGGLLFKLPSEIKRLQSESNYTRIFFSDGSKLMLTKTLKEMEGIFDEHGFMRIHSRHIVNLSYIKEYVRASGGYVVMDDDTQISISRSKKELFLDRFQM